MRNILLFATCLTLLCLLFPMLANAEPLGFKRPRSTFALGIDVFDAMLGNFGNVSDVGMSVFVETTLQVGGYYGIHFRFGSARAFTKKNFLPFDDGYQFVYFVAAPRFNLAPFRKQMIVFYLQPEIELQILVSNTLVKITGNDSTTGAAGGSIGIQYVLGILSISGQASCRYNWDLQSLFVGGSLSVGLSNIIK